MDIFDVTCPRFLVIARAAILARRHNVDRLHAFRTLRESRHDSMESDQLPRANMGSRWR
jgi:hypothetical protein